MGGGLESRCVGRVYGADGAVRLARHHPQRVRIRHIFNVVVVKKKWYDNVQNALVTNTPLPSD